MIGVYNSGVEIPFNPKRTVVNINKIEFDIDFYKLINIDKLIGAIIIDKNVLFLFKVRYSMTS